MVRFHLNDRTVEVEAPPGAVLLDLLRDRFRLTGVKEGCREGDCGSCVVLVGERTAEPDGIAYRTVGSCLLPVADVAGCHVVTIEGLNLGGQGGADPQGLNPAQQAFVDEGATQCGFCTPGFIVALAGFFLGAHGWTEEAALAAISGNLCRCTGYVSIRRAVARICARLAEIVPDPAPAGTSGRTTQLVEAGVLPAHFAAAGAHLEALASPSLPHARDGILVAGGTDLFVERPRALVHAELRLLLREPRWRGIRSENGGIRVGAATTVEAFCDSEAIRDCVPIVDRFRRLMGSAPIRARATVGGNLVHASPAADVAILLLALRADVEIVARDGSARRRLPLAEFFLDYKKVDLGDDEIVAAVSFETPPAGARVHFEKVSKRTHLDIASVNAAAQVVCAGGVVREAHLAAGGIAPVPLLLRRASAALVGRRLDAQVVLAAAAAAEEEARPIDDVRGSAAYKRRLLGRIVRTQLEEMFPEITKVGGGSAP